MTDPTIPPRMSRIEKLMANLDGLASASNSPDPAVSMIARTSRDARQLILDLLGMSDLPRGERIYAAACARIAQEYAGEAGELPTMIRFTKQWLPDCFPATDDGQVPFARGLCESLVAAAEAHLAAAGQPVDTGA